MRRSHKVTVSADATRVTEMPNSLAIGTIISKKIVKSKASSIHPSHAAATEEMVGAAAGVFGEARASQRAKWAAKKRRQRAAAVPGDSARLGAPPHNYVPRDGTDDVQRQRFQFTGSDAIGGHDLRVHLLDASNGNADFTADISPIRALIDQGCDLEADVLPIVARELPELPRPLKNWGAPWLAREILAARDQRLGAVSDGARFGKAPPNSRIGCGPKQGTGGLFAILLCQRWWFCSQTPYWQRGPSASPGTARRQPRRLHLLNRLPPDRQAEQLHVEYNLKRN